jgi:hypothetical protein
MLTGAEPLISIVTLNYNQTPVTCEFLASTSKLLYKNFEILVCDMASDIDPTPVISAGNYPKTRLLLAGKNLPKAIISLSSTTTLKSRPTCCTGSWSPS